MAGNFKPKGEFRHQPGQLVDIMATLVEIGKAKYPRRWNGNTIIPMEGKSLVSSFNSDRVIDKTLYFSLSL